MWSQPNIVAMNAAAKEEKPDLYDAMRLGFMPKLKQHVAKGKVREWLAAHPEWQSKVHKHHDGVLFLGDERFECLHGSWSDSFAKECSGELYHTLWYDIFSEDPKGILTLCEHHEGYSGSPCEGYFTCADCERVVIENYTWEKYNTIVDDEEVCLPCAAKRYIADEDNWIELTDENIAQVDFTRVRKAKHVIGVDMPIPAGVKFFDNAEFDSGNGQQISGSDVKAILTAAKDEGHTKALLILDAAYQFAVSIGVYIASAKEAEAAA